MKYSRNKINTLGKDLIAGPDIGFPFVDANLMIDEWRKQHMVPLEALVREVTSLLAHAGIVAAFSSHRLKRMTSIVAKLQHNPEMGLGGMQDVGGARFVFEDIPSLLRAQTVISQATFENFIPDRAPYDYVARPKESGYRSIHFVYKYKSENKDFDGLRVELQIRTRLQHDWAVAVETAELVSKSSLKASLGDENWLEFFKLTSAIFARKEGMAVPEFFQGYSEQDFCAHYARLERKHNLLGQLSALVGAVKIAENHFSDISYAVVLIQFAEKTVQLRYYKNEALDEATAYYTEAEKSINNGDAAVVLVSVSDMKELKEAYPSYFLNANEFIQALREFNNNCFAKYSIR